MITLRSITQCLLLPCIAVSIAVFCPASNGQAATQIDKKLYIFDVQAYFDLHPERDTVWQYDVLKLVASLQGLVNRPEPGDAVPEDLLYILYAREGISSHHLDIDRYWLGKLRCPGELLADYRIIEMTDLVELLLNDDIREHYQKVVLWDPQVPATANVAATICAVESLLPVRYVTEEGSLFSDIVGGGPEIMVGKYIVNLFQGYGTLPDTDVPSTGSRKADAYRWAKVTYLDGGLTDPSELAYYPDAFDWDPDQPGYQYPDLTNTGLLNHDFFISKKAFFIDLDPWWDEQATDAKTLLSAISPQEVRELPEGVDTDVLKEILHSAEERTRGLRTMIRIGGFVPWWIKYSSYKSAGGEHDPEETQKEFLAIASSFNAFVEGDSYGIAGLANASVFQHAQLAERFEQNANPPRQELGNKTYLMFYMGEYDSAAWLAQAIPTIWDDVSRGKLPLAWGINPTLSDRIPQAFNYLFNTRTLNDYFVGARSGAGWINPGFLLEGNRPHSGLSSGLDIWVKHNRSWYRQFDIQITGHVDNGNAGQLTETLQDAFFSFSPHGVGTSESLYEPLSVDLVPFCRHAGEISLQSTPVNKMLETLIAHKPKEKPAFQIYRCVLTTPTNLYFFVNEMHRRFPGEYEVVDPYTFFYLLRKHSGGSNESIPFFRSHTIPRQIRTGQTLLCKVRIRNDGWDIWNPKGTPSEKQWRLAYKWLFPLPGGEIGEQPGRSNTNVPGPVRSGETVDVDLLLEAPTYPNLYTLRLYLYQEGKGASLNYRDITVMVSESMG